jgi:amino acid adenylation domain-containing protein/non-ribosomal peptide synthase protein (TIGR01720 family)
MSRVSGLPLSSPQQQIWLHQQFLPAIPLYNIGGCLRIEGSLSMHLFERALRGAVAGADALRMVLLPGDPVPTQTFDPTLEFTVATHDLSAATDPDRAAHQWMLEAFTRPFALHGGPLFDFALLRTSATRTYWFYKYHHLVNDGWGMSLVVQRAARCYAALESGGAIESRDFGSYGSFVTSDRAYLESPRYEEDRLYWLEKLRDSSDSRARLREQVAPSRSLGWEIERAFYDALSASCRSSDASIFHLLLAAVTTYFTRVAGVREVVLGVPALNRRTAGDKATVGLYAGLKPARFTFDPRESAADFMLRIRSQLSRDYRHYRFPLARMSRGHATQDRGQAGLFDVVLSFEHHDYDATINGRAVHMTALPNGFEQNGLVIFIRDYHQREDVHVDFNYNVAAFTETEIASLVAGVDSLLHDMHDHPTRALGSHSLLPSRERERLVDVWSGGDEMGEQAACVHDWIAACARRHPESLALVCGKDRLTYGELEERANGLALRLRAQGVEPETCVGIALGRTPSLLVAVLAILKAGGAYVPIDGAYPPERIRWMVRDARVDLVLCDRGDLEWLAAEGVRLVSVESDERATEAPIAFAQPGNLAYVIYTSGSTGRPKGVMVSHRSIANYLGFVARAYGLSAAAGAVPLHSSLGFDATITSLLAPLVSGGCVEMLSGPNGLAALCEAMGDGHDFDLVKVTPSHLSVLEEELGHRRTWSKPRVLVLGGEVLNDSALKFWRTHAPATRIVNEYGPTEATVGCCVFEPTGVSPGGTASVAPSGTVPIGRPIWNTRLYVLNGEMECVPPGAVGELYVGGIGLARGYMGRPGLTAERFVADPFSREPGARLYRTGDLVRYCAEGYLEYVGRRDTQVKLRGHRVELGEVEAVMRTYPGVRDVAVRLDADDGAHPRVIAYVVPAGGQQLVVDELKRHARRWLPDVMVPTAWLALERLPLTVHGKVDRARLASVAVASAQLHSEPGSDPALTALEQELVTIWSQVLGAERVGIHDNFFDLHGDSILALRIVGRARARGIVIDLPAIFKHQTIAELSAVARPAVKRGDTNAPSEGVAVVGALTPVQHWLVEQAPPDLDDFMHVAEIDVAPDLDVRQLETVLAALVAHHPALRLRLRQVGEDWRQEITDPEIGPLVVVEDMTDVPEDVSAARLDRKLAELRRAVRVSLGQPIRALLCVRGSARHASLFLAVHHAAVDVVSWGVLLDDMDEAFQQVATGRTIALAPATSFAWWARHQAALAMLPEVADEAQYWLGLSGVDPVLLPLDGNRQGTNTVGSSQVVNVLSGADLTASVLSAAASDHRGRVQEILVAALACAVARLTGRRSLLLDVEGHGRECPLDNLDLSRTVGWLTTIFPVHIVLPDGAAGCVDAVDAVKWQLRAVPHGGHGYGLLRYLSPDRELRARLATIPRPDLIFNYVGRIDGGAGYGAWFREVKSLRLVRGGDAQRSHRVELDVSVVGDELLMQWTFNSALHSRATIERLARLCVEELATTAALPPRGSAPAAAEFPAARLTQNELERFLARFK